MFVYTVSSHFLRRPLQQSNYQRWQELYGFVTPAKQVPKVAGALRFRVCVNCPSNRGAAHTPSMPRQSPWHAGSPYHIRFRESPWHAGSTYHIRFRESPWHAGCLVSSVSCSLTSFRVLCASVGEVAGKSSTIDLNSGSLALSLRAFIST